MRGARPTARLLGRARQLHQLKTDTRLESALKEARDDDDVLVERFTQTAYQALGAAVLHEPSVVAPLAALCAESAVGRLPRADWTAAILASHKPQMAWPPSADGAGPPEGRAARLAAFQRLRLRLQSELPAGAHDARLRRVLAQWPEAAEAARSLTLLMQGAQSCNARGLQDELLDRYRALPVAALPGSGSSLLGLVQLPLLAQLGAPEARPHLASWGGSGSSEPGSGSAAGGGDGAAAAAEVHERGPLMPVDCFLAAAALARRGDIRGPKHGCVLVAPAAAGAAAGADAAEPATPMALLGAGFNHHVRDAAGKLRHVHAETHALADAVARLGRAGALAAFGRASAWVVELVGGVGYEDAHPCIHCTSALRAVGVRHVRFSTGAGGFVAQERGPGTRLDLLSNDACGPLRIALEAYAGAEVKIT